MDKAGEANDNSSGDKTDRWVIKDINNATEGAGNTPDGSCNTNTTDSNLDEDNEFWHVDFVVNEIHAFSTASHKYNHYLVLYNMV